MKRGFKFILQDDPPCGMDLVAYHRHNGLLKPCGVPLEYDNNSRHIAHASGIWPFKRIIVGPGWFSLSHREQMAVLLHEVWHCKRWHLEARVIMLPFFAARWWIRVCKRQELSADAFVVRQGYGIELCQFLSRIHATTDDYHPSIIERRQRMFTLLKEHQHELAA